MSGHLNNADAIPLLDLGRQFARIREEVLAAIEQVCASQHFILGSEVESLEGEVAAFTAAEAAVGCSSGTDALWLALVAAGVKPGDRVITTPFSFFASASSVVRAGAEPVFVDVDSETLNLDPDKIRAALDSKAGSSTSLGRSQSSQTRVARNDKVKKTRGEQGSPAPFDFAQGRLPRASGPARSSDPAGRITALLPVHLYGQCADMDAFQQLAQEFDLLLIEDAAQAIGAKWREQLAGSFGATAAFSFYPTKNLSAYGEAGIVTTQDPEKAEHMRRLRNHGSPERYFHTEFGWNARMDAIQAAVLRVKLKHLPRWNELRRERAGIYDRLLVEAGLCPRAALAPSTMGSTRAPFRGGRAWRAAPTRANSRFPTERLRTSPHAFHIFHQYVIRARRRDELRKFLAARGIATEVYYPTPLHLQPVFAYLGYKERDLPESERAAKEVLALPMFPELTEEEQKLVVAGIAEFYT